MLAAAILAAGESKRMGQPKALVPFQGSTFVDHLIAATRHPLVGITRVVLGAGAEGIRASLKVDASWIVVNADWPTGQLSSIHAAIRSLPAGATEGILVCPVDHPLISAHLVGQCVCDAIDERHKAILPPHVWGDGEPEGVRQRAAEEMKLTARAARRFSVSVARCGEVGQLASFLAICAFRVLARGGRRSKVVLWLVFRHGCWSSTRRCCSG